MELRSAEFKEGALEYRIKKGGGPSRPILLLHPWFGSWKFWLPTVSALAGRDILLPDLYSPGKGKALLGPEDLSSAVVRILDQEGLDQIDLVGNSLGGIVSQLLASTSPERIGTLTLVGTGARTAGIHPEWAAQVGAWTGARPDEQSEFRELIGRVVDQLVAGPIPSDIREGTVDIIEDTDPGYVAAMLARARTLDLRPRLAAVTAWTMIVRGELDCARTPEHVRELLAGVPCSVAVEIKAGGHSPMIDHAEEFNRLLLEHLGS